MMYNIKIALINSLTLNKKVMKNLLLIIMLFPLLTFAQWNEKPPIPMHNLGWQSQNDLLSKAAVPGGMSLVLIGFPTYYYHTNTNYFHNQNSSQQSAQIFGILSTSLVSGVLFGLGKEYYSKNKCKIKRKIKRLFN